MDLNTQIEEIATSLIANPAHFLVDVIISGNRVQKKLIVIVDGDNGLTIEDCVSLSRSLSAILDESNLISENYTLEVTTPGIDFPLKLKRQYKKNVGRGFKVSLKDKTIIKGKLIEAKDESIELEIEEKTGKGKKKELKSMDIPFELIDKAFVQISFK